MIGDLKQLLAEVSVLVKSATVCGEAVLASSIVDSQAFTQLMIFLHDAGVLCASAHQFGEPADPDVVFPRFGYSPGQFRQPNVINPRPKVAREVLISACVEGSSDVVIDPPGAAKILPFKGS
jgi:hypothetical protein